jgi:hypothetical protein
VQALGRGGRDEIPLAPDRAALDARLAGLAAFLLVAGLAVDDGGFHALSWDRALLGLALVVLVTGARRASRAGGIVVCAAVALAAWTALSYLWSESPPVALDEAQRVTLYAVVVAVVVLVAPRVPAWSVVGGATVAACWNLVTRANGIGHSTGAGSEPVGYANALALLCVLGIVLLPVLPRPAWLAGAPLAVVLVLQHSSGAYAALALGVVAYCVRHRPLRVVLVAAGVAALLASPFLLGGHERDRYWHAAAREARAHPVLGSGAGTYANWWLRERSVPQQTQEAHSLYVETWAELGPVGLALVLVVLAVPLAVTRRPELAAGVAAYAAGAAVDFDWELAGATVPALIVVGLAVADARRRRPLPVRPLALAVGVAALLAYLGNARLSAAQDAARRGDFVAAQTEARSALRWQPYSPEPWRVLGDVSSVRVERVRAYRRATELDPADWSLWQRLAGVSTGELRRLAEAKATQLNPLGRTSGS